MEIKRKEEGYSGSIASTQTRALHMKGGTAKGSYNDFSKSLQSNLNEFYWPKLAHAIAHACCTGNLLSSTDDDHAAAPCFAIADYGCSCAWSTISAMRFIATCIIDQASSLSSLSASNQLHIQAFFNDLPSNDFNTLFSLLYSSQSTASAPQNGLNFFPCGLPGSFYSRLFPPRYIRIGLCTLALHNLSMVPKAIQDSDSHAWNENGIWTLEGCKSETIKEYRKQFEEDFGCFLQHRSQELVPGGLLFCVMIASPSKTTLHRRHQTKLYQNLQTAWRQLIIEGLLDKDSIDAFNLPIFLPTVDEVKQVVMCTHLEDELKVVEVEYMEVERAPAHVWKECAAANSETWGSTCETMIRNFVGSLLEPHLGHTKFELLMERLKQIATIDDEVYRSPLLGVIVLVLSRS